MKLTFICILLFVCICLVWARSYSRHDEFYLTTSLGTARGFATAPGELILFANSDLRNNSKRLMARPNEAPGLKQNHYLYPPSSIRQLGFLERYLILTHVSLMRTGGSGPRPFPEPKFKTHWTLPGISAQGGQYRETTYEEIVCSFWLVLLLTAPIPVASAIRLALRRKRIHRGLCTNCNYDLRASKNRCPECGHPIPTPRNPLPTPPPVEADPPR